MKKLTILFLVLALSIFPIICHAEDLSVGGSLTPPVQTSADTAASNMRPSPEWLAAIDAEHISDICTLLNDPTYLNIIGISENLIKLFDPAEEYAAEPSFIIYAPARVPAWLKLAVSTSDYFSAYIDSPASICNLSVSTIYATMNSEDLARSSALILESYYPVDTSFAPTITFYISADGCATDVIMISHIYTDGIMHVSARFISDAAYNMVIYDESHIGTLCRTLNADMLTTESEFAEFDASIAIPDGIEVPYADDAWLSETAIDLAREMTENKCAAEYAELFTSNQPVIDICTEIGSFDFENAEVVSIQRYDNMLMAAEFGFNMDDSESPELIKRYIWPKLASAYTNSAAAAHGTEYLAAQSICTLFDTFFAESDFVCCNVTLSCGDSHNIVVSFSKYDNRIVNAVVHPVPAE